MAVPRTPVMMSPMVMVRAAIVVGRTRDGRGMKARTRSGDPGTMRVSPGVMAIVPVAVAALGHMDDDRRWHDVDRWRHRPIDRRRNVGIAGCVARRVVDRDAGAVSRRGGRAGHRTDDAANCRRIRTADGMPDDGSRACAENGSAGCIVGGSSAGRADGSQGDQPPGK